MTLYDSGESIYNIIPPKEVLAEKPPMYRSKHDGKIPPTASTFAGSTVERGAHSTHGHHIHQHSSQKSHPILTNLAGDAQDKILQDRKGRTFGQAPGALKPSPQEFMKKSTVRGTVPTLAEVKRDDPTLLHPTTLKTKVKPALPVKADEPVHNLVTSKNFIVANAVETILAAPKKVSVGAKDYLKKEDYGKVPQYLKHIKNDIEAEYDYIRQLQQQEDEGRRARVQGLDENERLELIDGLKQKWETVNTSYQATTHLTKLDTIGKIKRKEKYEAELSQIEKDIEKLNRANIHVDQYA